jgi:hypothetical protein
VRVESTTDPLELGTALDLVAGTDDVAAGVDLLGYELAMANVPAITASGTIHSTRDLKEGS